MPAGPTSMPSPRILVTMSSTRSHWRFPTWEGPRQAAPMQKRVLPASRARRAACSGAGGRKAGGQPAGSCSSTRRVRARQADPMQRASLPTPHRLQVSLQQSIALKP